MPCYLFTLSQQPNLRSQAQASLLQNKEERTLVLVSISIVVLFVSCTTPAAVAFVLFNDRNLDDHFAYQVVRFLRFWHKVALAPFVYLRSSLNQLYVLSAYSVITVCP